MGLHSCISLLDMEVDEERTSPLKSYSTAMDIFSSPSRTSNFVRQKCEILLLMIDFFTATASNHPHLLGLPVVAPNSTPTLLKCSPFSSYISVGKGPEPTRVVYAFMMPRTWLKSLGPSPVPADAAPATVFEEVTYGYVP